MGRPRGGASGTYGLRRRSPGNNLNPMLYNTGMELMMECHEEVLSPSQIEAARKAKEEYKNAQKKIEEAKAEVARLAAAAKAEVERQAAARVEAERQAAAQAAAQAAEAAANLARHIHAGNSGSTSPDIMIVGESPPRAGQKKAPPRQGQGSHPKPVSGPIINSVTGRLPANMAGVPQEIYRFANHGQNNNAAFPQQNQWLLRPLQPGMQVAPRPVLFPGGSRQPGAPSSQSLVTTIVSGTSGLGIKRAMGMPLEVTVMPPSKKIRGRFVNDSPNNGNGGSWVPLDEYYYGKMEGDPTFLEDKGEFRFRCWICTKMLYNNVKAMVHLQGHIDSEKQQNLDLSNLTQCKHCYKQFDTPFEMQTHIEKVHLSNMKVLMCRICEKDHESRQQLTTHMRQNHCACEMPYSCQLCHFRSSMYSDVVDHFKKKHDSSDSMLCLYCLRVFHVKFVSQGWGQTQVYYHHLLRHQSKTANRKCTFCKLSFFNVQDMKAHRKAHHLPNQKGVIGVNVKHDASDQVMIKVGESGVMGLSKAGGGGPKSLNAPAVSKVLEHRGMRMPQETACSRCFECNMRMNTSEHYKKYIQCSMCRFATSCSFAYATHMMGFHSGQLSALSGSVPSDRPLPSPLHCLCGFSSTFGNQIANHLVYCSKRTGYLYKPELPVVADKLGPDETDPRHKPDASILDVLGLVKKPVAVNTSVEGEGGASRATPDVHNIPDKDDKTRITSLLDVYKVKSPPFEQDERIKTDASPPPTDIFSEFSKVVMDISASDPVMEDSSPTHSRPPSLEEEEKVPEQSQHEEEEKAPEQSQHEEKEEEEVPELSEHEEEKVPEQLQHEEKVPEQSQHEEEEEKVPEQSQHEEEEKAPEQSQHEEKEEEEVPELSQHEEKEEEDVPELSLHEEEEEEKVPEQSQHEEEEKVPEQSQHEEEEEEKVPEQSQHEEEEKVPEQSQHEEKEEEEAPELSLHEEEKVPEQLQHEEKEEEEVPELSMHEEEEKKVPEQSQHEEEKAPEQSQHEEEKVPEQSQHEEEEKVPEQSQHEEKEEEVPELSLHEEEEKVPEQSQHEEEKVPEQSQHEEEKVPEQSQHEEEKVPEQSQHEEEKVPEQSQHEEEKVPEQSQHEEEEESSVKMDKSSSSAAASEGTVSDTEGKQQQDSAAPQATDLLATETEETAAAAPAVEDIAAGAEDMAVSEAENCETSKMRDDRMVEDSDTSKPEDSAVTQDKLEENSDASKAEDTAGAEEKLLEKGDEPHAEDKGAMEAEDCAPWQAEDPGMSVAESHHAQHAGDCAPWQAEDPGMAVAESHHAQHAGDASAAVVQPQEEAGCGDLPRSAQDQVATPEPSGAQFSAGESGTAPEGAGGGDEPALGEQMEITQEEEQQETVGEQPEPEEAAPPTAEKEKEERTPEEKKETESEDTAQKEEEGKEEAACDARAGDEEGEDTAGQEEDGDEGNAARNNGTDLHQGDAKTDRQDSPSKERKPEDDEDTSTAIAPEDSREDQLPKEKAKDGRWGDASAATAQPEDSAEVGGTGDAGSRHADRAQWTTQVGPTRGRWGAHPTTPSSQPTPQWGAQPTTPSSQPTPQWGAQPTTPSSQPTPQWGAHPTAPSSQLSRQPEESPAFRKDHTSHSDKREENQRPALSADKGWGSSGSSHHPQRPYSSTSSSSSASSDRDRQHSRDYDHRDRSYDRNRDYSDNRDYRRDRSHHDRNSNSRDYYDRHNQQNRQGGGRYDSQHGRYPQGGGYQQQGGYGSQDRYHNQNRQANNRGSQRGSGHNYYNNNNRGYY